MRPQGTLRIRSTVSLFGNLMVGTSVLESRGTREVLQQDFPLDLVLQPMKPSRRRKQPGMRTSRCPLPFRGGVTRLAFRHLAECGNKVHICLCGIAVHLREPREGYLLVRHLNRKVQADVFLDERRLGIHDPEGSQGPRPKGCLGTATVSPRRPGR